MMRCERVNSSLMGSLITAESAEISLTLPRGVYAKDIIEKLYAFTDCEISLSSQLLVIHDGHQIPSGPFLKS